MVRMLMRLLEYCDTKDPSRPAKAIVWAHNSHLGDARFTERGIESNKLNIGQLVREQLGLEKTFNIGFTTFHGSVTAAHNWGEPHHFRVLNEGMKGSYERLFHDTELHNFYLVLRNNTLPVDEKLVHVLSKERYERAVGVIYRPRTEMVSHYFTAALAHQFDAVIHFDRTRALYPLDIHPQWLKDAEDMSETYPFGV